MDKISFWQLLNENNKVGVVIPIIQRDYAQGRIGKEHIREKFLTQIKAALEDRKNSGELDFVYGTTDNGVFYPLDGQQRLTTLWLLHWFVASKTGNLDNAKEKLKKFSYETRTSSRELCEKLCEFDISNVSEVSDTIQKQTWFYTAWKQDPTIQSMLRMLKGTEKKDKQGYELIDGLEKLFADCSQKKLMDFWDRLTLTNDNCPIKFSKLEIKSNELPVSDDLYIKMNARGKPLTDFENFKADLISSLEDKVACEYGGLIDNGWTNHFWNQNEIDFFDAKWMAFLCRFAVCAYIENESNDCSKTNKSIADNIKEWSVYKNDTDKSFSYAYKDFRDFKDVFNTDTLKRLKNVFVGWGKLEGFTLASSWGDDFCFIPRTVNQTLSTLTMKTRVLFYGTMLFCEKLHFCEQCEKTEDCLIDKWNAWKRVMWNLAENTNESSTLEGFVGVMKMFKQLGGGCLDIYKYLDENGDKLENNFEQLKEEKDKAKKILCEADGSIDWEKEIIEAENHAFFRGAIRFLFRNGKGDVNWMDFNTKYSNTKKYFDKDGIRERFKVLLTKSLVLQCSSWDKQLYDQQIFNPDKSTWRWILCARIWEVPIHNLLVCDNLDNLVASETLGDENANKYIKPILESLPYSTIIASEPSGRFRWYGPLAFYRPKAHYAMFTLDWGDFKRNSLLQCLTKNKGFELQKQHIIEESGQFYKGWDIHFKYENHCFLWSTDNKIYLLDDKNQYKKDEKDRYLCFDTKDINCVDTLKIELEKLAE